MPSPPPSEREPAKPTPPVCVCGYDLAGLPTDADAKCPECGAVIDSRAMAPAMRRRSRRLATVAASPPFVFATTLILGAVLTGGWGMGPFVWSAFILAGVSWPFAIAAAIAWDRLRSRHCSEETRYMRSMGVFFACLIVHPLASLVVLWMAWQILKLVGAAYGWVNGS